MKNIDHMFYIPIFHYKVDDWKNKKKKLLDYWDSIKNNCKKEKNVFHNYKSYNSKLNYFLHDTFIEEINNFLTDLGKDQCRFLDGWFENTIKHGYHPAHNHGSLGYSSVCFINYDSNLHTPTRFFSPFNCFITGVNLEYVPKNITEGSIIFFPSIILHCTEPNNWDTERLIASFNLSFD